MKVSDILPSFIILNWIEKTATKWDLFSFIYFPSLFLAILFVHGYVGSKIFHEYNFSIVLNILVYWGKKIHHPIYSCMRNQKLLTELSRYICDRVSLQTVTAILPNITDSLFFLNSWPVYTQICNAAMPQVEFPLIMHWLIHFSLISVLIRWANTRPPNICQALKYDRNKIYFYFLHKIYIQLW